MKAIGKKFLTTLLIILLLFNFIYGNYSPVFASEPPQDSVEFNDVVAVLSNVLGGVVGVYSYVPRLIAMALGLVMNIVAAQIAYMDGATVDSNVTNTVVITPFNIFFNDVQILDVNFLDLNINQNSTTYVIRQQVAQWYYIMRLIASAILLIILIFVGIKMAISTVAEEKAIYKKTLVDWATSLALIFLLQYIIMFTVNANSAIVKAMKSVVDTTGVDNTINGIALKSLGISWQACGATVVYCMFVFQTFVFIFTYIKRMLTVGFLIIISPLISITYSIDRMGDGKAQALNTWLKEFIYGVLIQPFHCVMYMAFLDTAFNLLKSPSDNDLANAILAILCMRFIDDGEKIVRKIFGFESASSVSPLATAAAAAAVMNGGKMAVNAASTVRKGINMSKQNGLLSAVNKDKNARIDKKAERLAKSNAGKSWDSMGEKEKQDAINIQRENIQQKQANTPIRKLSEKMEKNRAARREKAVDNQMRKNLGEHEYNRLMANKDSDSYSAEKWDNERAKAEKSYDDKKASQKETRQKIKGAVGKVTTPVGNAISKAANSNIGRYLRTEGLRKMTSAGVGLALGGMALGASNTGALTSIGAGIGVYKGVDEFRATSTKTLAKQSTEFLDGRVANETECQKHIEKVKQSGDNGAYNGNSEEVKELIKNMKEILMGLGYSSSEAASKTRDIQQRIQYDALTKPQGIDLNRILQNEVGEDAKNEKLQQATADYKEHALDANLYAQMQKGAAMQMGTDEFIKHMTSMIQFAPQPVTPPSTEKPSVNGSGDNSSASAGGGNDSSTGGGGNSDSAPESGSGSEHHEPDEVQVRVAQILQEVQTVQHYEEIIQKVDQADVDKIVETIDERIRVLEQEFDKVQNSTERYGETLESKLKLEKITLEASKLQDFQSELLQAKPNPPKPENE